MNSKIKLVDIIVLLFLFLTGIIIILGRKETESFSLLIGARLIAILAVFSIIKIQVEYNNRFISFFRQFYPLIFTAYFYSETAYYNHIFFPDLDGVIINAEEFIFGFQPSLSFSAAIDNLWFNELMYFSYFSFYIIVFGFSLIVFFKRKEVFEKSFFIIIFSLYSYYLFFVFFPVVGPQFYFSAELAKIPHPLFFGKLIKLIQEMGETPTGAFPSSHVGISWIILIIASRTYKKMLLIIYPLAILICFSTVYIKAHYVIDVVAGLVSAPFLYFVALKIYESYNKVLGYLTSKTVSKY